jgi:hypothetical protein
LAFCLSLCEFRKIENAVQGQAARLPGGASLSTIRKAQQPCPRSPSKSKENQDLGFPSAESSEREKTERNAKLHGKDGQMRAKSVQSVRDTFARCIDPDFIGPSEEYGPARRLQCFIWTGKVAGQFAQFFPEGERRGGRRQIVSPGKYRLSIAAAFWQGRSRDDMVCWLIENFQGGAPPKEKAAPGMSPEAVYSQAKDTEKVSKARIAARTRFSKLRCGR